MKPGRFKAIVAIALAITLSGSIALAQAVFAAGDWDTPGGADVLVENSRPSVLPGLGLGYPALSAINPRIVMTSITGFGQTDPYRDFKMESIAGYALGGHQYINSKRPDTRRYPASAIPRLPRFPAGMTTACSDPPLWHQASHRLSFPGS